MWHLRFRRKAKFYTDVSGGYITSCSATKGQISQASEECPQLIKPNWPVSEKKKKGTAHGIAGWIYVLPVIWTVNFSSSAIT
jgi:hypothetical protein